MEVKEKVSDTKNMMTTEVAKSALRLVSMSKDIPKAEKMVTVASKLSATDQSFIKEYAIGSICVKIDKEVFFLNSLHKVPSTAVLVRQDQGTLVGQVVGIPAVAGG